MRTKFNVFLTLLLALVVQITFAQEKVITGVVTEEGTGEPIPGANVIIKGTNIGAATDFDGKFTIKAKEGDVLVISVVGYQPVEKKVGASNTMNIALKSGDVLETVVITGAQGIKEKPKEVSYAQQVVKEKDLTIGKDNNIKTALSGKVAGVQVQAQAGSKLGQNGKVYLRGAISALGRAEALYIVDGVETSPDNIDMDNVASINVLKGPAAVSLYGLRGADGVIIITTKEGKKGQLTIDLFNNTTFENVAYLPNYQNEYGQGYDQGDFAIFDPNTLYYGAFPEWANFPQAYYHLEPYADESWGPKFEGQDYYPWYTFWPGENNENPYFGKPQKWQAQPDNVKNFYNTGINSKSGFAISGGTEKATGRVSFSTNKVSGLIPTSSLSQNIFNSKFKINVTDKFTIGFTGILSKKTVSGGTNFDDSYGNAISGSFNQWFGRDLETDKMKELKNLKTIHGFHASWNWWSADLAALAMYSPNFYKFEKPVFWFNPYWQLDQELYETEYNRYVGKIDLEYQVTENFKLIGNLSRNSTTSNYSRHTNYLMQFNSNANTFGYTNYLNSMTESKTSYALNEGTLMGDYNFNVNDDIKMGVILGLNARSSDYTSLTSAMQREGRPDFMGFSLADVFNFANSKEVIKPVTGLAQYKTYNVFSRVKFNFKDYLFLTGDISNVWDSRYDMIGRDNDNSFMFGSAGLSFIFTEAFQDLPEFLNYGKLRLSYAEVGSEVSANRLNPGYRLSSSSYQFTPLEFTPNVLVNPNISPATSNAFEAGIDLKMLNGRTNFSLTYFNEHRKNEIISTEVPYTTGYASYLVNAGDIQRTGLEIEIGGSPVKTDDFEWNIAVNFANPYVKVLKLAEGQNSQLLSSSSFGVVSVVNIAGEEYGQLQGSAINRDANGTPILIKNVDPDTGEVSYAYDTKAGHNFGSILPDFNGGIINRFRYKNLSLAATINYQKGGKFFSLTEWWGTYTGILEETAGLNDKGNPKRDDYTVGGGVHVIGVLDDGTAVDAYTNAHGWYQQQYPSLAEGFIHDASYIKLSEVSIMYTFPKKMLGKRIKSAQIGVVGRNLGLLYVDSSNKHKWDPSELAYMFGDDAQLPGTRSFGFNIKLSL